MQQRIITGVAILFCLTGAVQTVGRMNYLRAPSYAQDYVASELRTWDVWMHKTPLPEHPTIDTIPEFAPNVYRLLSPALCKLIRATGHTEIAFWGICLLSLWGAYLLLFFIARHFVSTAGALIVVICAFAITGGPHHTSFPFGLSTILAMLLIFSCIAALLKERWAILGLLFSLAFLTREDALIISALAAVYWLYDRRRTAVLAVAVTTFVAAIAIRAFSIAMIGYRPYYCDVLQLDANFEAFAYLIRSGNLFHPIVNFFTTFLPLGLLAAYQTRGLPSFLKAALVVCVGYIGVVFVIARPQEAHRWYILLPLFVTPAIYTLMAQLRIKDRGQQ